jgi:hypothetical protein
MLPSSTNYGITIHSKFHYFSMRKSSHYHVLDIDSGNGTTYKHCHCPTQKKKKQTYFGLLLLAFDAWQEEENTGAHAEAINNHTQRASVVMIITFSKLLGKCSRIHKGCLGRSSCAFV